MYSNQQQVAPMYVNQDIPQGVPYGQQPQILGQPNTQLYNYGPPLQYPTTTMPIGPSRQLPQNADGCSFPITIQCPYCRNITRTFTAKEVGSHTVMASCLIALCCWPLFWLPCCMEDCQNTVHYCGGCAKNVGVKPYKMC